VTPTTPPPMTHTDADDSAGAPTRRCKGMLTGKSGARGEPCSQDRRTATPQHVHISVATKSQKVENVTRSIQHQTEHNFYVTLNHSPHDVWMLRVACSCVCCDCVLRNCRLVVAASPVAVTTSFVAATMSNVTAELTAYMGNGKRATPDRCKRRWLDLVNLHLDMKDTRWQTSGLIPGKMVGNAVRERFVLFLNCIESKPGQEPTAPYLYPKNH